MTDIFQKADKYVKELSGGAPQAGHKGATLVRQLSDEIVRLRLDLAEARRALEISRSNAVYYDGGVLIAAFDQYGRQIYAHKVVTL